MIKHLILFTVLLYSTSVFGQGFDSLVVKAYQSLSEGDIVAASELAHRANNQINDDKSSAGKLEILLAQINWKKNDFAQSIIHYQRSINILKSINDNSLILYAYLGLGLCYKTIGDYEKSLSNYLSALELFKVDDREKEIASTNYLLANLYSELNQHEKAMTLYKDLLAYHKDSTKLARIYNSIGYYYYFKADFNQAIANYSKALNLVRSSNLRSKGIYTHNIGDAFIKLGKLDLALAYLNHSLELRQKVNNKKDIAKTYTNLGRVFVKKQSWQKAHEYLTHAEVLANELSELPLKKELYEIWIEYSKEVGKFLLATQYFEKLITVKDSLLNQERIKEISLLEVRYETEKKEEALKASLIRERIQQESLSYQKYAIIALASILILLMLISFLVYRLFLLNRKEKDEVKLRMREQHHRMENNISVLASILSLAARETKSDEARVLAKDGENRLNAINLLHKELYWDENQVTIQLDRYVNTLSEYLVSVFLKPGMLNNPLVLNLDAINLDVKTAIPLSLILNELITNAFKHGMDSERPRLGISLRILKSQISLVVEDNGSGMGDKKKSRRSFGMQLIDSLVSQIRGELKLSSDKNGTRVELLAPI